jgi:hypothetical protein
MNRIAVCLAAAALAAGCAVGKKYWVPEKAQMAEAERIASVYVLQVLGDQAGQPEAMAVRCEPGRPIEYPLIFTIGGRPYTRFRTKMWGSIKDGRRIVNVQYFDPAKIGDWDTNKNASGPFPAYFSVPVDIDALAVRDGPPRPAAAP